MEQLDDAEDGLGKAERDGVAEASETPRCGNSGRLVGVGEETDQRLSESIL